MYMVGQGRVHRSCRQRHSRWMYQPKHKRHKIDWDDIVLWLAAWAVMFSIMFLVGVTWLYS